MNTNNFNKINVLRIAVILLLTVGILGLWGCQPTKLNIPQVTIELEKTIAPEKELGASVIDRETDRNRDITDANGGYQQEPEIIIEGSEYADEADPKANDTVAAELAGNIIEFKTMVAKAGDRIASPENTSTGNKLKDKYSIPERFKDEFTAADGWLKVFVDADILLPQADKLPVAQTQPADFEQGIVTKLFSRLCGSTDMFDASGKKSDGTLVSMQGSYTTNNEKKTYSTTGLNLMSADKKTVFNVTNLPVPRSATNSRMADMAFWTERGLHDFSDFPVRRVMRETAVPKEAGGKLSITPLKAREKVESLIKDTGLIIADAYLVDNANHYTNSASKASRYAYKFLCTRSVNGVPTSTISGMSSTKTGEMQSKSWRYEMMEVIVDDAGIIRVYWYSPHKIDKVTNNDANLLPFSDIKKKFQDAMIKEYGRLKSNSDLKSFEVRIGYISLQLQRVTDDGSIDNGTYVPAWNFYGSVTDVFKNGDRHNSPKFAGCMEICLSINAIDGSVIKVPNGY